jgi:hypothetical protein
MNENISWLEVSVYDFLLNQLRETADNLPNHFEGFVLTKPLFNDELLKIAVLAELSDYV